jgi:hypothetical protein
MDRIPQHQREVSSTAFFLVVSIIAVLGLRSPTAAEDDPADPGGSPLRLELPAVRTNVGAEFEVRLEAYTAEPVSVFAIRVETAPAQVRLRSWSFGAGLVRHIALHGEPPACDVIVYPDGSRLFAVMVLDPPFSSQEYGSECLVLDFAVEAERPVTTCILYSGDTPDYEPGEDLIAVLSRMGPERECALVTVLPSPALLRGDVDGDASHNLTDAVRILHHLFLGSRAPDCADAADANDDGFLNLTDCVLILNVLFLGAEPPWTGCEVDRTEDSLPACRESSC